MNPIKKLNEFIDMCISIILKVDKCTNNELLLLFGTACLLLGGCIAGFVDVLQIIHEEPIRHGINFVSLILLVYFILRMIFGKNQLVSEILKRMDKE